MIAVYVPFHSFYVCFVQLYVLRNIYFLTAWSFPCCIKASLENNYPAHYQIENGHFARGIPL
jgi:hypothetical protein